jgi:hypothetical protein
VILAECGGVFAADTRDALNIDHVPLLLMSGGQGRRGWRLEKARRAAACTRLRAAPRPRRRWGQAGSSRGLNPCPARGGAKPKARSLLSRPPAAALQPLTASQCSNMLGVDTQWAPGCPAFAFAASHASPMPQQHDWRSFPPPPPPCPPPCPVVQQPPQRTMGSSAHQCIATGPGTESLRSYTCPAIGATPLILTPCSCFCL